ncbi:MAG: hotdog fold domain-containing protein [Acidimicrobiales bacterium]
MPESIEEAHVYAARRLRDVMHAFMAHEQDPSALIAFATVLESHVPVLTAGPLIDRSGEDWAASRGNGFVPDDGEYFANDLRRPFSGAGNPFSVPYDVQRKGHRIEAKVVLRPGFEGAPKRSHGGFVAAIFDDLAGYLLAQERRVAFTAWIRVDYKAPTPIGEPIVYRAWVDNLEERKLLAAGDCLDESGQLLATCKALFVTPRDLVPDSPA